MASLGTLVNRFVGVRDLAEAPSAIWTRTETPRLRPLANEDVYLFVKAIDNGSVVRVVDPAARRARNNTMATGFVAAMLVIAGLVPTAYNIMSGFTIQHLQEERTKLEKQRAQLDAAEADLLNPNRMRALAKSLKMSEPEPQQVQTLEGPRAAEQHTAVASNALPFGASGAAVR
jgi:cell division protein FtsL